jgi:hypothetical protein
MEYRQGLDAFLLERPLVAPGMVEDPCPALTSAGPVVRIRGNPAGKGLGGPAKARDEISYDQIRYCGDKDW